MALTIIKASSTSPSFFNLDGLDYPKSSFIVAYGSLSESGGNPVDVAVSIVNKHTNEHLVAPRTYDKWSSDGTNPYTSLPELLNALNSFIGSNSSEVTVKAADSPSIDAFARLRVSNPITIFDSKQIHDNQALFWDDQEETGTGTSSTHDPNRAGTTIAVGTGAGKRTRQTFMRFNYQAGKSQLILMTFVMNKTGGGTGITKTIGYGDDDNGIFLQDIEGVKNITIRSNATGTPVDIAIPQTDWNIDKMDGTGASGITLDFTKSQIFIIDFEWLGVGRVRTGVVVDGLIYYTHQFLNANDLDVVYMSTPNLPLRYQIENDGTGVASSLEHICTSVMSEGGVTDNGVLRYSSTEGTHINADVANTLYAIIGIRLKSTHIGATIKIATLSMVCATTDDYEWVLMLNPTVAVPNTWNNEANSAIQTTVGSTTVADNVVTGGTKLLGGLVKSSGAAGSFTIEISNALLLGSAIDGSVDEIYLCCRPLAAGADIDAGITWREIS